MINNIKIGPINYVVSEQKDLHTVGDEGRKVFLNGHIQHSEATIKLDVELSHDMQVTTLWHEALHGILAVAGQDDPPEKVIITLGYGIVSLLRDNPDLIAMTLVSG